MLPPELLQQLAGFAGKVPSGMLPGAPGAPSAGAPGLQAPQAPDPGMPGAGLPGGAGTESPPVPWDAGAVGGYDVGKSFQQGGFTDGLKAMGGNLMSGPGMEAGAGAAQKAMSPFQPTPSGGGGGGSAPAAPQIDVASMQAGIQGRSQNPALQMMMERRKQRMGGSPFQAA